MFNIDKKRMYLILRIVAGAFILSQIMSGEIVNTLYTIPGLLLGLTIHEYGHALFAYMLGDKTAKEQGRLSLNPMAHIDPIGAISMILFHFGWGKPVSINPANFKQSVDYEKGEALVAFAGPLFNFITAFVLMVIYVAMLKINVLNNFQNIILTMLMWACSINISLGVFNLIPIPPLDGSKIIRPFLPNTAKDFLDNNESILSIVLLVLVFTGLISYILTPAIQVVFNAISSLVSLIF